MNVLLKLKQKYYHNGFFDMSSILDDEDIEIYNHDLSESGYVGYLARESDEKWSIGVEESLDAYYKRFVMAHELGHYFLHSRQMSSGDARVSTKKSLSYRDFSHVDDFSEQEDFEANTFAAQLLMPDETVLEALDGYDYVSLDTRKKLSKFFGVPEEAVFYRLRDMGYEQR